MGPSDWDTTKQEIGKIYERFCTLIGLVYVVYASTNQRDLNANRFSADLRSMREACKTLAVLFVDLFLPVRTSIYNYEDKELFKNFQE